MNNNERIQARIARDKERRLSRKIARNVEVGGFNNLISYQNYLAALKKCNVGVMWKSSVQRYNFSAVTKNSGTIESIRDGKPIKLKAAKQIYIKERGKSRIITPVVISDRITQRVICDNHLLPLISNSLIYDNGASLKGKGVSFTRKRAMQHIMKCARKYRDNFYILTFDFKKFFDNIPHIACYRVLNKYLTDKRVIKLIMDIILSYKRPDIMRIENEDERTEMLEKLETFQLKGICLGSQISQILALVVPNELDHYIKDVRGVKHYVRYMDDGLIMSDSKEYLCDLYVEMKRVCEELGLIFNEKKTKIVKASKGFTFLKIKYRVLDSGRVVRVLARDGIVRMRRKLKKYRNLYDGEKMTIDDVYNSIQSRIAHMKLASSYISMKTMVKLCNSLFPELRKKVGLIT